LESVESDGNRNNRASKEEYVNMEPIFRALRFNRFFETVTLHNVPRKEIIGLIADTMAHNSTIK